MEKDWRFDPLEDRARLAAQHLKNRSNLFQKITNWAPSRLKESALGIAKGWTGIQRFLRGNRLNRILGVWNFNVQTGPLGDCLAFQEVLNVLRVEYGADKVDLCFVDDPTHPNASNRVYARSLMWKKTMTETAFLNPSLGSIFHYDSEDEFKRFLRKSYHDYRVVWPSVARGQVAYDLRVVDDFFKRNGYIPCLSCRPETINWALNLVEEKVSPSLPIVFVFRNNTRQPERNTDLGRWGPFFEYFSKDDRYKFITVCYREEVTEELRQFENVLISKDYGADFERDCGLIQAAHACIGSTVGMLTVPVFSGIPALTFGLYYTLPDFCALEDGKQWSFLTPFQKQFWGRPTSEEIIKEFSALMKKLDQSGWRNPSQRATVPLGEASF